MVNHSRSFFSEVNDIRALVEVKIPRKNGSGNPVSRKIPFFREFVQWSEPKKRLLFPTVAYYLIGLAQVISTLTNCINEAPSAEFFTFTSYPTRAN